MVNLIPMEIVKDSPPAQRSPAEPRVNFFHGNAPALARSIVNLAINGTDGSLITALNQIDSKQGLSAIKETLYLYLYLVERAAITDETLQHAEQRTRFLDDLRRHTIDLLLRTDYDGLDEVVYRESFLQTYESRVASYSVCPELHWMGESSTKNTVIFRFYENLQTIGHEIGLLVLTHLQIPALERECAQAFGTTPEPRPQGH